MSTVVLVCCLFFFFKQKTAYEMRISDWSSDVCSSDLRPSTLRKSHPTEEVDEQALFTDAARPLRAVPPCHHGATDAYALQAWRYAGRPDGRVLHADRKSVV